MPAGPIDRPAGERSGAGTGALMAHRALRGGVGTASIRLAGPSAGVVVGAVAVVNAHGTPVDPVTGRLLGTGFIPAGLRRPPSPDPNEHAARPTAPDAPHPTGTNTTLAVVATNATLDPAQCRRTATAAHDGIARALQPAHTLLDGDTVFALSTGELAVDREGLVLVQAAAADAVLLAVLDAVLATSGIDRPGLAAPAYLDLYPSVAPPW